MPELSPDQVQALLRLYQQLGGILGSVGVGDVTATPEPQWRGEFARIWRLLHAVRQAGGDLSAEEWARLGIAHDYDPRGLGGFFRGAEPMMAMQGERRVLTEHGLRFIERWERDFGRERLTDEHGTNTLIRQRRGDGGEFENVIDADPEEVREEYDRIKGHGLMLIRDRRSDDPGRASGLVWQVWTSSLVGFEPTDRLPDPLPTRLSEPSSSDEGSAAVRQLARIMELVGEVADIARVEVEHPPERIGVGVPGTWTRTTGLLSRIDAQAAVYDRLGGPPLPAVARSFTRAARQLPTNQRRMVGDAEGVLAALTNFMENANFSEPSSEGPDGNA
jgi:hypothetical protein